MPCQEPAKLGQCTAILRNPARGRLDNCVHPVYVKAEELELRQALREAEQKVHAALQDSMDLSTAMSALFDLMSKTNIYMKAREQQYEGTPQGELTPFWLTRYAIVYFHKQLKSRKVLLWSADASDSNTPEFRTLPMR